MKRYVLIAFIFLLFLSVTHVSAQSVALSPADINVEFVPEIPKPLEKTFVSIVSYVTDLNKANITWSVNDKVVKEGIGERTLTFKMGDTGKITSINIFIKSAEGKTTELNYNLKPSSVDLIWETKSFTPPFYKGKAVFSHQNQISFIAIPHMTGSSGNEFSANNLVYTWKNNGSVVESASGYGKNVYTTTGSVISRPLDIDVEVSSLDDTTVSSGHTTVTPTEPFVALYERHPLYGIQFQKALTNTFTLTEPEVTVTSMPFFFGTNDRSVPELTYTWKINGSKVDDDTTQTTRVFRRNEGVTGSTNISVSVENTKKILQFASGSFVVKFDNPASAISPL